LRPRFAAPKLCAPSPLLMRLYTGFSVTSSEYVRSILAQGLWRKSVLDSLLKLVEQQQQQAAEQAATPETQEVQP
jgi:hypothetical protein